MDVVLGVSWTAPGSAMEAGALLVEQQSLWPRTHLKMNPMGEKIGRDLSGRKKVVP